MSPIGRRKTQPTNWGKGQRVHQEALAVSKNRKNDRIPHIYKRQKLGRPKRGGGAKVLNGLKVYQPQTPNPFYRGD